MSVTLDHFDSVMFTAAYGVEYDPHDRAHGAAERLLRHYTQAMADVFEQEALAAEAPGGTTPALTVAELVRNERWASIEVMADLINPGHLSGGDAA